ncbi:MAG: nucleotide exchange factor GrpE [Thiothrix sp.]|nr:MAG: nucleotide exchange factor GrpE [Thiothrix sp.]
MSEELQTDHNGEYQVEQLVDQFRAFLQQEDSQQSDSQNESQDNVTLFTLFTELATLKTEVKRESRQVKEAVTQFGTVFDTLKDNNQLLSRELEQRQAQKNQTLFASQESILVDVIDFYDRLGVTLRTLETYKPSWLERRLKRDLAFRKNTVQGLAMTRRRVGRLLARHDIESIPCVGKPLDPHRMRAVKIHHDKQQVDGIVVGVVRHGYIRRGEVLRLAEVIVNQNKAECKSTDSAT